MPRVYRMGWDTTQAKRGTPRWRGQYKGKRLTVSVADLGLPRAAWTKEGSRAAANEWFEEQKKKIDGGGEPWSPEVAELRRRIEWAESHPAQAEMFKGELEGYRARIEWLEGRAKIKPLGFVDDDIPFDSSRRLFDFAGKTFEVEINAGKVVGIYLPEPVVVVSEKAGDYSVTPKRKVDGKNLMSELPDLVAQVEREQKRFLDKRKESYERDRNGYQPADLSDAAWHERIGTIVPVEKTLAGLATKWSTTLDAKTAAGLLTGKTGANKFIALKHFLSFAGEGSTVEWIERDNWEEWYLACRTMVSTGKATQGSVSKYWTVSREFVRWLYEGELLESLPRNWEAHKMATGEGQPGNLDNDTIATIYRAGDQQMRAFILLCLNCGMTQKDVCDLRPEEIDWRKGTITRKRSKMESATKSSGKNKGYPVTYRLWGETIVALRATVAKEYPLFRSSLGNAMNPHGWIERWTKLMKRTGEKETAKILRKTGVSRLANAKQWGQVYSHPYAGHEPTGVHERNYAELAPDFLDSALAWLRLDLGVDKLAD